LCSLAAATPPRPALVSLFCDNQAPAWARRLLAGSSRLWVVQSKLLVRSRPG